MQRRLRISRLRIALSCLILQLLLAGCGAEKPPRLGAAGPRLAEIPRREAQRLKAGAILAAAGRQAFQGASTLRCVPHEDGGLQLNFRTGDAEMPVVAVRIADYHGDGNHPARLFVTGRSRTGALVTSTGEATVEIRQRERPDRETLVLLQGKFSGDYSGKAGKGSVEGRFNSCRLAAPVDASPALDRLAAAP